MSHQHSRKSFLAKLFGIAVAAGAVPALLSARAKPANTAPADVAKNTPIRLRPDTRSIARRDML